ncbi:MAG: FAD-dependent oxidoreductase [Oscillospiraceae bacterium]|nr:FAD-dependent oxidoreductase [Oscillospiraceae bacterium]
MPNKRLKCMVCGAAIPNGAAVCPVCGAGADQFTLADSPDTSFRRDTNRRFIIAGAGVAGVSAAAAIRDRDNTASIVLLDAEDHLPYHRPMLTKTLLGARPVEGLVIHDESWYARRRVTRITGQRAESVRVAEKTLKLESGAELLYDVCILAMGASSFIPPIPGADARNAFAIRSLDDAIRLESAARQSRHAAVIGGGALGLEAAWALREGGLKVSVIETLPRLLDRKVTESTSAALADWLDRSGIDLSLGARVEAIETVDGKAIAVRLSGGRTIPTDIVIISAGITPNAKAAESSGIKVERGVVVDERMLSSAPDVYACGDCAIFGGVRYGLWPEAEAMGAVAGANAAGDNRSYSRAPLPDVITALGDFIVRGA